jgi:hypothetical protein
MINALATAEYLISIKKNEDARTVLDIMYKYCTTLEQLDSIGKLYAEIREFEKCHEIAYKLYDMSSGDQRMTARTNIVRACLNLNKPHEALKHISFIEKVNPKDHPNRMDKAMSFFLLNRKKEGESILRSILNEPRTEDIDFRVKFNLGTYDLANGNFKEGLRHVLLDGRKLNIWHRFDLPIQNMWEGGVQKDKTILMCAEGGIGDEIISVRFQKHFRDVGMKPVWFTDRKDLLRVFKRNGFDVIDSLKDYRSDWLWCYSMASPTFLDLEEDQLWSGPYITPLRQSEKLDGKIKIGIKCMGNPKYDQDLHRSIPAKEVIDLLPKDATIYSFHVDEDIDDARVVSLRDKIKSWDDTLDYIDQMDFIISSCTSLAHAASAMSKRTAVMVPILNYYTWARPEKHSKWYSENTTIIRQKEYDNWNAALEELKDYIHANT